MFFQSSRVLFTFAISIFLVAAPVYGQAPETVLASVDGVEITLQQVDDSVAARIYPLQQQLYAIRRAALKI